MRHLRVLMRFTGAYFWPCTFFGAVLYCVMPLTIGLATRSFFDVLTGERGGDVWPLVWAIIGLQLCEIISEMVIGRTWSGFTWMVHVLMQRNLFAGILRGFGRWGLPVPPGDAISRFQVDPVVVTMGSMDGVCDLIGRAAFAVVGGAVMWSIDPLLTVAAFVPVVIGSAISDALGSRASRYGAAALASTTSLSRFLGELVNAQLAVRVAGAEERVVERIASMSESRRRLSLRDRVFAESLDSMNMHLVHVSTGAVLLLGAAKIRRGEFTIGDFAMFVIFLDQLTYLPCEIGRVITQLKRTAVSMDRMHALIPGSPIEAVAAPAPIHVRGPMPVVAPVPVRSRFERLDVRTLTSIHRSSGRGVRDVSFSLARGSFTVVTGRIGSGKSTLLHAVLGLLPVEAGSVAWNGVVLDDPSAFLVPPRCAFTPQVPRLFGEPLGDNLRLGRDVPPSLVHAAVSAAVLDEDVAGFEHGLDTLVGPRGVKLSGGQVQRAAAARMFLGDAEVLVLDDISSALDASTEAELWRRLFDRADGVTVLAVSHSPVALSRADQVLTLVDGHLS